MMFGNMINIYYIGNNKNVRKNICSRINININDKTILIESLKYPNQYNCILSGTQILYRIYKATKDLNSETNIQHNILIREDASKKYFYKDTCSFILPYYYILLTGESWYNKMGFYSVGYNYEVKNNEKLLNIPLYYIFKHNEIVDNEINIILEWFNKNTDIIIDESITINKIIKHIDDFIKDNKNNEKYICESNIIEIINIIIDNIIKNKYGNLDTQLIYDNKYLTLNTNNKKIIKLYEALGKKIGEE